MTHATKVLIVELAYLRSMHAEATNQANTIIANQIGEEIADVAKALEQMAALAKLAETHPAEIERVVREELLGEMYFSHWAKWEAEAAA